MRITPTVRATALVSAVLMLVAACDANSPLPTENQGMLSLAPALKSASAHNPELAQQLAALKAFSAKYHNISTATADYPTLFSIPGLTSPDGCISDATAGGMGYHYAGLFGVDDHVNYLEPELLVFAPPDGQPIAAPGDPHARLAAFDYFVPYSAEWPEGGPAPTTEDMGLAISPLIEFAPSRFGGWMFHIWLWEKNPGGMFANWNTAVPLCANSPA